MVASWPWLATLSGLAALGASSLPLQVAGDGRELVATDPTAVKIRAEDGRWVGGWCLPSSLAAIPCRWLGPGGARIHATTHGILPAPKPAPTTPLPCLWPRRRVEAVNISPFLSNLPFGKDTTCFQTPDASGSTSQARSGLGLRLPSPPWRAATLLLLKLFLFLLLTRVCLSSAACPPPTPHPTPHTHTLSPPVEQAANIQEALEAGAATLLVDEVRRACAQIALLACACRRTSPPAQEPCCAGSEGV